MFRLTLLLAASILSLALAACGADPATTRSARPAKTGDALGQLRAEQNALLDGGLDAFTARLAELRGHPVVVNQWASWCGPCQFEFPFFRDQARKWQGRVAFLGVNSRDSRSGAEKFVAKHPVSFPHYVDQDARIARSFRGGRAWPTTAYYNAKGRLTFTHQGAYGSEAQLAQDVRSYALNG